MSGKEYSISFANGRKTSSLKQIGTVGQRNTGTTVKFLPEPKYFDSVKYSLPRLKHTLRAKAVLCPGLEVVFHDLSSKDKETISWQYEGGLTDYLLEALDGIDPENDF